MKEIIKGEWMSTREKKQILDMIKESKLSVKESCAMIGLNTARYYRWKKQYKNRGLAGLENKKSTPAGCTHKILASERQKIIMNSKEI